MRGQGIKTLIVVAWDKERGGVVSAVENLARYLQSRGHDVFFLYPGKAIILREQTTSLGFRGFNLRLTVPYGLPRPLLSAIAFPFLFPIVLAQLIWFLQRENIQIVNLHYPFDSFFYFALCRHFLPIRLITSIHGSDSFDKRGRPKSAYSRAFRYILGSSDQIVLPSQTYKDRFLEAFPGAKEKTVAIHNGIYPEQFRFRKARKGKECAARYILCIASLRVEKGIDILLQASRTVLANDPSLSLLIAGSGPLFGNMLAMAAHLGIQNQTRFLGTIDALEVAELLHDCDVFVLPSRAESFGIVLIEALACKKPVIATRVGGIPEIIEHEVSGLLVEPENVDALANALQRMLENSELRKTLGENGYHRVMARFCYHHTGAAYELLFASLLDPNSNRIPQLSSRVEGQQYRDDSSRSEQSFHHKNRKMHASRNPADDKGVHTS